MFTYGLLFSVYQIVMAARQILVFFFPRLISEVAWPIVTKLCHMVVGDPDL